MIDVISFVLESIMRDRRLRIIVGIAITIIAVLITSASLIYGDRLSELLNKYSPVVAGLFFSILGITLALSTQRVGSLPKRKGDRIKLADDRDLIKSKSTELADMFHTFRIRMLYESERLRANSFKNLAIGIIFSFSALMLLTYFVIWQEKIDVIDYIGFITNWLVPRLTIVLLLQFVGFFFLRLYVANELDLKHNKNEITNIEAQIMAYAMSKEFGSDLVKIVVHEMSSTERNFVIKKGEKSISFENESQYNDIKDLVIKLVEKLPDKK